MKISGKFTLAFLVVFGLVLGINSYLRIQRESSVFETDMRRDHETFARGFAAALARTWETSGRASALILIEEANQGKGNISMRWTEPDADSGSRFQPAALSAARRSLQTGRDVTAEILNDRGQDLLHTYVPVLVAGQPAGALELSESLEDRDRYVQTTIHRILVNTLVVFVLTGTAFAALGGWFVGRPVNILIHRANAIAQGDLEHMLQLRQKDELGQLARALNTMCDQLAAARDQLAKETAARIASLEQLRHADRLATVGQFASEVAHEFGTPLNVMMARAKMIRTSPAVDAETQNNAHIVAEQAERMTKIIRQLLDFARPKAPRRIRVDLRVILKRAADLLTSVARGSGVVLKLDSCGTPHWTDADPEQLQQVVANLVVNAVQATPPGGEVNIGCRLEEVTPSADIQRPAGRYCCIYVADQGQGISAEDLPRVFEPFFTTKRPGEGTGLGLSVSRGIITEHRGWIQVESEIGKGSRFTVYIPEGAANEESRSGG